MNNIRQNWQMFSGAIPEYKVDEIVKLTGNTAAASTFNEGGSDVRKSRVAWLTNNRPVLDLLYDFVDIANRSSFNAHIYKKADIQFTEYLGSEGGHYSWHHDIDWNRNDGLDRKLSVTVQLSSPNEYEGGDFSFNECQSPDKSSKEKGTVLVFPSYLQHAVQPVTSGVRRSLVAWFEGPRWT
jgi:PKHD-type hydroxylase